MSSSGMEASHTSAHKGVFVVPVIFSGHIWVCFDGYASCARSGRNIKSTAIFPGLQAGLQSGFLVRVY